MARLQDVILRGLAASKPVATAVAPGTLYYSTDTQITERSSGTVWESYADVGGGSSITRALTFGFGGSELAAGKFYDVYVPYACTISAATILGDVAGNVVFDIKKSAAFGTIPTTSIVAATPPTLTGAAGSQDTTMTAWTLAIAAGSRLRASVVSTSGLSWASLVLTVS